MIVKKNRTAIILAGGKSSRMKEDKGLILIDGKPMIKHVIDVVRPFVDEVIIIVNDEIYNYFGLPVYHDVVKGKGPLGGLHTGLSKSNSDVNIVLSCDVPYVSSELISFLLDESKNYEITIPIKENKTHQLIGVFLKSCKESFEVSLEKDHLKLLDAFKNLNLNVVDANQFDEKLFTNLNSPSDIKN